MQGKVAAGFLSAICEVAEARRWAGSSALLDAMMLDAEDLADPTQMLPLDAFSALLVFLQQHTRNPGIGVDLGLGLADLYDLRKQSFWGYALLSSMTLRQRIEMYIRYHGVRYPAELRLHELGGVARIEGTVRCVSDEALPVLLECIAAYTLTHFSRFFHPRKVVMKASYVLEEKPHHRPLLALCAGPVTFGAPLNSIEFPAAALDFKFDGDPYLNQLACAELDRQAARTHTTGASELVQEVRERLERRLARDATLDWIARDLRISARTLQRKLGELGASFQDLLEELRKTRAHHYLIETDRSIEEIGERLGYSDAASFRRAFRRWTGMAPAVFRARQSHRPRRQAGAE